MKLLKVGEASLVDGNVIATDGGDIKIFHIRKKGQEFAWSSSDGKSYFRLKKNGHNRWKIQDVEGDGKVLKELVGWWRGHKFINFMLQAGRRLRQIDAGRNCDKWNGSCRRARHDEKTRRNKENDVGRKAGQSTIHG